MVLSPNIIEATLMWSAPSYSITTSDNFRKASAKFQKVFQVLTKREAIEYDLFTDERFPRPGDPFSEYWPNITCDGLEPKQAGPTFWTVTASYTGELAQKEDETYDNPLFAPPRIDWDDVESEEEIDEDWNGQPIQTVNREPIEGIKTLIPDQTVTIKRNMLMFNPYVQSRYRRSVNSDLFLNWPPGTAKLMKLSASNVITKDLAYWEVTGQIRFRYPYRTTPEKAWYARARHEGYYERIELSGPGAGTAVVRAVDGNKEPMTRKVLLDAQGFRLAEPEEGEELIAHWLEFQLYDSLPYNELGLI
jgi:hypothetical protein